MKTKRYRLDTLTKAATCSDCGADLEPGTLVRSYPNGAVYGTECHSKRSRREPLGMTYSRLNPHGVFLADGTQIGSTCNCIDYPCCGH